ncbi:hypothetical protein [Actinokineospora sp. NBRC 105648]|uniref:hypothetical protein n=1 Tax=Actinokineospora sp. NBRC 105648 TaxID=3032206 RepID=UPI0025571E53|nr:hypothetical protein [Actinokineospora sp. NBRC 105648]
MKRLSVPRLRELSSAARTLGAHACGRPEFVSANGDRVQHVFLMPIGLQSAGGVALRCYVAVVLDQETVVFTLDVTAADFAAEATVEDPWELAEAVFYGARHVPVDGS